MGVFLYFAFGALNIGLLFLINYICKWSIGMPVKSPFINLQRKSA